MANNCALEKVSLPSDDQSFICNATALFRDYDAGPIGRPDAEQCLRKYIDIYKTYAAGQDLMIFSKVDIAEMCGSALATEIYGRLRATYGVQN